MAFANFNIGDQEYTERVLVRLKVMQMKRLLLSLMTLWLLGCDPLQRTTQITPPVRETRSDDWARDQLARRVPDGAQQIPARAYDRARDAAAKLRRYSAKTGQFVSPAKIAAAPRWESIGPNNIAGRMRTLVFDPRNPNRLLAGGVSGGVWISENAGASWTAASDSSASINVGALAIDPVNPDVVYVGTGELYRNNDQPFAAMWGQGIWRSVDGGRSFQQLLGTANENFRYVADIALSAQDHRRFYAATNSGVWRSDDGGASFVQVLRPVDNNGNLRYEGCSDVLVLPASGRDHVLVACASRSTDDRYYVPGTLLPAACNGPCPATVFLNEDAAGAGSWTPVLTEPGMGRTSMDYARSSPGVVYAVAASIVPGFDRTGDGFGDYNNGLQALWRSNDGGRTWEARLRNSSSDALSTYLFSYGDGFESPRCGFGAVSVYSAGWYNQAIAVNPLNPEVLWVAGMDHFRSDDGGRSFGKTSYYSAFGNSAFGVHADQHFLTFHPNYNGSSNRQLFSTNDGGITVTDNDSAPANRGPLATCGPTATGVQWRNLAAGLVTTQFYTGTVTTDGNQIMGGLQDNGTVLRTAGGGASWRHIYGGDGAGVAIDPRNRDVIYASSQYIGLARSVNGGNSFTPARSGITGPTTFIMPYVLDRVAPDRLFAGTQRIWRSDDQGRNWRAISTVLGFDYADLVSAVAVSAVNPDYLLSANRRSIFSTRQGLQAGASTTWTARSPRTGWVSSLVFDPVDANVAYATYSTFGGAHVWQTIDAGSSWNPIDGSAPNQLPDIPVHTLAIDPGNRQRLFIGTDIGVFVSIDGGRNWAVENTGFANVITESLQVAAASSPPQLFAFTYGRGAWRVPLADLDGVPSYAIDGSISGAFYDPLQNGHGWKLEAIVADGVTTVLGTWFTYSNGEQRWVSGLGVVNGNKVTLKLSILRGGNFPPNHAPSQVIAEPWGEADFSFESADKGQVQWRSSYPGFSNGEMPLTRLTRLALRDNMPSLGRINSCHSGSWYNLDQNGHGLMVEVIGEPGARQMLATWFTYLNGQQRFLYGVGPISGDTATMDFYTTSGGRFPNFDPSSIVSVPWGQLRFIAINGSQARLEWTTEAAGFSNGTLNINRLTTLIDHACF